jgi:hypothetical protein
MNWTRLLAATGVAVLVSFGANAASPPPASGSTCDTLTTPPALVETPSKYDQTDPTRSVLVASAAQSRDTVLRPIRTAVQDLYASVAASGSHECAILTIANWATANALGDMRSEDAFLSRDRLVSETVLLLLDAAGKGHFAADQRARIEPWLRAIAHSTIEFYDHRAGRRSRLNNHRYWAGLAVGSIGYLLGDDVLVSWATDSFRIGVCQVDARGYLPLELARGSQALNYHVYALRPLLAFAALAETHGDMVGDICGDGLTRLTVATRAALADPLSLGRIVGTPQAPPLRESNYPEQLRLAAFGF